MKTFKSSFLSALSCMVLTQPILLPLLQATEGEGSSPSKLSLSKTASPPLLANPSAEPETDAVQPFEAFTGKVTKNKVRMRLNAGMDSQVIREYNKGDLVVVLGETDDFYAIEPPCDARAYVFRTYILDNVVEGSRVNVRIKPELDAPVVAQLNSGDRVEEASIYPANNKWLEIKIPPSSRFYIAKDYVEKVGDVHLMAKLAQKQQDVYQLLKTTEAVSYNEMQKPFEQVNLDAIKTNYLHIILDYPEFPEAVAKAKELLTMLQEDYVNKKMEYLEVHSHYASSTLEAHAKRLAAELQEQKNKISALEKQLQNEKQTKTSVQVIPDNKVALAPPPKKPTQLPANMSLWLPKEENLYARWLEERKQGSPQDYYAEQRKGAFTLKGILDPYTRSVKNKPGDYLLLNSNSKLPVSYLYSTQVNLQDFVGHEVSLLVTPRPNNHYAFPAYFVLEIQ